MITPMKAVSTSRNNLLYSKIHRCFKKSGKKKDILIREKFRKPDITDIALVFQKWFVLISFKLIFQNWWIFFGSSFVGNENSFNLS